MIEGNQIIAKALASQDLKHCFGIVGVPVIELGSALQAEGIHYYGCRNEQGASYSAQAVGYLTGRPGISLCVSGPGMVHAMAGIANAWSNCWPMIVIAGASDSKQDGKGGFQESNQLSLAQVYCKYAYRVTNIRQIPYHIEKAVKYSIQGRPGPVYLEFPGDILAGKVEASLISYLPKVDSYIRSQTSEENILQSLLLLQTAKNPLIVVGKGAAYARAEQECEDFLNATNLPFLPTPMGKGVVSDTHKQCVGPARSTALGQADVILLVGARLNWMLHFGQPPRFQKNVKIIQIDICPEEFDTNVKGAVNLLGDIKSIMGQFNRALKTNGFNFPSNSQWWQTLNAKIEKNKKSSLDLMLSKDIPMTHYSSIHIIHQHLPKNFIYVGEGANTMDIGRTIVNQLEPRSKLDAGTYGTMGIGIPFALAAQAVYPERPVVAILGDSAFGFSAMEIETAIRYNMPLIIFVINNNGIFFGHEEMPENDRTTALAPTSLNIETRYEKMATAFGGKGYFVKTHQELTSACQEVFKEKLRFAIVNVMVDPYGARKPQEHGWLTKEEDPKPKL